MGYLGRLLVAGIIASTLSPKDIKAEKPQPFYTSSLYGFLKEREGNKEVYYWQGAAESRVSAYVKGEGLLTATIKSGDRKKAGVSGFYGSEVYSILSNKVGDHVVHYADERSKKKIKINAVDNTSDFVPDFIAVSEFSGHLLERLLADFDADGRFEQVSSWKDNKGKLEWTIDFENDGVIDYHSVMDKYGDLEIDVLRGQSRPSLSGMIGHKRRYVSNQGYENKGGIGGVDSKIKTKKKKNKSKK